MTGGDKEKVTLSPYYLSSSDKPGDQITQVRLRGDNYDEWAVKVGGALRARKKTGFIDGTIKKPDANSDEIEDWYMVNAMIVGWIFNTIEEKLGSSISYVDEAKLLWDDIEQRFNMGNGPKLHRIKGAIAVCKQSEKESVSDYYARLKRLWDELDKYDRNPTCKCTGCKCDINQKLDKKRDESKVHDFLLGLDSKYSTISSSLLLQEPLPSLNKAYSTLIQEEGVRVGNVERNTGDRGVVDGRGEAIGFSTRMNNMSGTRMSDGVAKEVDGRPKCEHCKKPGHNIARCYDLIGYPKNWRDKSRAGGKATAGANSVRLKETHTDNNDPKFVTVPKDKWDAYVNHAKTTNTVSTSRMTGPHIEDDDWYG